jgi:hypothetical protein
VDTVSFLDEDEDELQEVLGMPRDGLCAIVGCENPEVDERGPVYVMADGVEYQVAMCSPHWEGIFMELGKQGTASWNHPDGEDSYDTELQRTGINLLRGYGGFDDGEAPEESPTEEYASKVSSSEDALVVTFWKSTTSRG